MKTSRMIWELIWYRPHYYIVDSILWIVFYLLILAPGLILREFFDLLSGQSRYDLNLPMLIAAQLVASGASFLAIWLGGLVDIRFRYNVSMLLRRNMLAGIFKRPGAQALTESVGETISRLRDDTQQAENAADWTIDAVGQALFALAAFFILLDINAQMTLWVFLPLVVVVATVQVARTRLENYRRGSRLSAADVTGALGDMFAAIQAIQVANAEEHVIAHFRKLSDVRRQWALKDRVLGQILQSIFELGKYRHRIDSVARGASGTSREFQRGRFGIVHLLSGFHHRVHAILWNVSRDLPASRGIVSTDATIS